MSYHGEKQAMGRIDDLEQAIDATHRGEQLYPAGGS